MTRAYFVSDLHLSHPDDERTMAFVSWLGRLAQAAERGESDRPTHVFLVGDIFDLWIGGHEYFTTKFSGVIEALRHLVELGVEVHFFEGNHDLHLARYWQGELGVAVHPNEAFFQLAGKTVRVEHGDMMNPDDKGYRFLRAFLRTSALTAFAHHAPAAVIAAIGERASRMSRSYQQTQHRARPEDQIRQMVRMHARKACLEKPFDLLISGHVHVADDFEFENGGRSTRSVNLGSWTEKPFRAFLVSDETAEFVEV